MPIVQDYQSGTVSVAGGDTAVSGAGTAWVAADIRAGDTFKRDGYDVVIASVESNTALTLAEPWPGDTLSDDEYRIRFQPDGSRYTAAARTLVEKLASGNVDALAGLAGDADTVPIFTGPGTMAAVSRYDINGPVDGFRNKIINGNFDIWQRATSYTHEGTGNAYFTADRWYHSGNYVDCTVTMSREEFTLGQTDVPGDPKYFMRVSRTVTGGSASGAVGVSNRIEDFRTLANKRQTVTFYARASKALSINLIYHQDPGTSGGVGGPKQDIIPGTLSVQLTTEWQRFDIVCTAPSLAGFPPGTDGNDRTGPSFQLPVSEGNASFDLARVSIVEGDVTLEADPFEPRHISQELLLCQRYYWKGKAAGGLGAFKYAAAGNTAMEAVACKLPVTMRIAPTVTIVTAPAYSNCVHNGILTDKDGFVHFVNVTNTDKFRAYGGIYSAEAEI